MKDEEIIKQLKFLYNNPIIYIENVMKIYNKDDELVDFKLNPQQHYFMENMGKANIILKSRQIGFTSLACALSLYIASTNNHAHCLLAADSDEHVKNIFDKLKSLYDNMEDVIYKGEHIFKQETTKNNKHSLEFKNGSKITCSILSSCKQIARSATISFCHISEYAFVQDDDIARKQLISIQNAMSAKAPIIIESTANGINYFSKLYNDAVNNNNNFKAFFFPWQEDHLMFKGQYKRTTEDYLKTHKALPKVNEMDDAEKSLIKRGATPEQIVWRRWKLKDMEDDSFMQEYPSQPQEAFLTTGHCVFNTKILTQHIMMERLKPIPENNIPSTLPQQLIPSFKTKNLSIWEVPKIGGRYFLGVDVGEGASMDYSVVEVIGESEGHLFQAAEYKSNRIQPYNFATIVLFLGIYYNKGLLAIEKASAGHYVLNKVYHENNYQNIYRHVEYDAHGKKFHPIGFETNAKTKPEMINRFVEYFQKNYITINSDYLLNEMQTFVLFDDEKMGAIQGYHDDAVMSTAISIMGSVYRSYRSADGWDIRFDETNSAS